MSHARSILGLVPHDIYLSIYTIYARCFVHLITLINKLLSSYYRYYYHHYHFSQSSVPIMALGGQFRVWPVEIGDGPRLVKLPPLLAPSKISYLKISKCISTKVYIFLAILYPAIKYFRLAL